MGHTACHDVCGWGAYLGGASGGSEDEKAALAGTIDRRWQLRRLKCWVRRRRWKWTKRTSAGSSRTCVTTRSPVTMVHSALDLVI